MYVLLCAALGILGQSLFKFIFCICVHKFQHFSWWATELFSFFSSSPFFPFFFFFSPLFPSSPPPTPLTVVRNDAPGHKWGINAAHHPEHAQPAQMLPSLVHGKELWEVGEHNRDGTSNPAAKEESKMLEMSVNISFSVEKLFSSLNVSTQLWQEIIQICQGICPQIAGVWFHRRLVKCFYLCLRKESCCRCSIKYWWAIT